MQNAVINVNGEIQSPQRALVSVFDRGYLYGDSLYEVVRTYDGEFFQLEEHMRRLEKSAELCRMTLGQSLDVYQKEIEKTLRAFQAQPGCLKQEAYCRIIVSRGMGKIGFGLGCLLTPTLYTVIVQPLDLPTPEQQKKGLKLQISRRLRNDPRALDPAMKSGNYLNSLLAFLEATAEGFDDALLCNSEGFLTEGTTFNIFYARRGIVATPPLDIGILDGITRRQVLESCRKMGLEVREVRFPLERIYESDEVFLSSSIKEVFPVTQVDQKKIGSGRPGPICAQLRQEFSKVATQRRRVS